MSMTLLNLMNGGTLNGSAGMIPGVQTCQTSTFVSCDGLLTPLHTFAQTYLGDTLWMLIWLIIKILVIAVPIILCVAYLTFWERKMIGWMHVRMGPNRVGPKGFFQPFADVFKLLTKEVVQPTMANPVMYIIAPVLILMPALAAWAVIPFSEFLVLANVNAGLLYIMAITSIGVYGVIIAGWATNSKYAFFGAMRASAQMLSYELAIGIVLLTVMLVSKSLNLSEIVLTQQSGVFADAGISFLSWNWLPLLPLFVIYVISAVAETNRHPFDVVEGESEIVAGHMVEYSGMAFALFFLAEYANMILLSALASIMFLGGWLPPFNFAPFTWIPGLGWIFLKTFFVVSFFIWFRASFPRYRYDQIMRLGWKVFIPVTLIWFTVVAIWMQTPWNIWK